MAVVIETTAGDLTVDLYVQERPKACLNFLKLCKLKYYNFNLFHTIEHGFIAQTGDPSGVGDAGDSVWGVIEGSHKRFFKAEYLPKIRHSEPGLLSMVSLGDNLIGSQFFLTLGHDLTSLDGMHCVIGQVTEGHEVLRTLNDAICDNGHRPYQDIRITHTVIIEDPFDNPRGFREPSRSPSPSAERLKGGRIGADEDIDDTEGKTEQEVHEMLQDREAKARATILEIVGDLPDAEVAPPENVLFVCKLNPVTSDEDLEIIFSRFGKVKGCEVIRDRVTGDSLQYAFVEFEDAKTCESAYFKMDNVLIDERRIHVDFSQSVAKVQWKGKGRGLIYKDGQKGNKLNFSDLRNKGGGGGGRPPGDRFNQKQNFSRKRQSRSPPPPDRRNRRDRSKSPQKNYDREHTRGKRSRSRSGSAPPDRFSRNNRDIRGGRNASQYRNDRNGGSSRDKSGNNRNARGYEDKSGRGGDYRRSRSRSRQNDRRRSRSGSATRKLDHKDKPQRSEQRTRSRSRSRNRYQSQTSRYNRNIEEPQPRRDGQKSTRPYDDSNAAPKKKKKRHSSKDSESSSPIHKKHKKTKKKLKKKKSKKSKKVSSSSSDDTSSSSSSSSS